MKKDGNGTDFANTDLSGILTLKTGSSTGAAISYAASIDTAKKVITLNPSSDLADGDVYVAISNNYYDAVGNRGSTASATFTVDTTGPAAPKFLPADEATVTDASTNITLTFAEAVKKDGNGTDFANSDLSGILTLKTGSSTGAAISYAASIDTAKKVVTLNPSSDLADGDVYVAISNGYYDAVGNRGSTASATFTVDTPEVQFEVATHEVNEDAGPAEFTLSIDPAPTTEITVQLSTSSRIAVESTGQDCETGDDYKAPPSLTVAAGETEALYEITICDDDVEEWGSVNEEVTVTIDSGTGYAVGTQASARLVIKDDDSAFGVSPGIPKVTAVTTGTHAPTATTLSCNVSCVSGGRALVTDYILWAVQQGRFG